MFTVQQVAMSQPADAEWVNTVWKRELPPVPLCFSSSCERSELRVKMEVLPLSPSVSSKSLQIDTFSKGHPKWTEVWASGLFYGNRVSVVLGFESDATH